MPDLYRDVSSAPRPTGYDVRRTDADAAALLTATNTCWHRAEVIAWGPARYRTGFRALWTAEALAVRWDVQDDRPWHTMRHRDACLWEEEVVEIFLDPTCSGRDYAELEINPVNVVCDLHIARLTPDRDVRLEWHFAGLRTAVEPSATGDDWTALALLPFSDFASLSTEVAARLPPVPGDTWAFNVFRIKRPNGPTAPERDAVYAAWSVPDGPSFHAPEAFCPLRFVDLP